jgi:hypothetical protein
VGTAAGVRTRRRRATKAGPVTRPNATSANTGTVVGGYDFELMKDGGNRLIAKTGFNLKTPRRQADARQRLPARPRPGAVRASRGTAGQSKRCFRKSTMTRTLFGR